MIWSLEALTALPGPLWAGAILVAALGLVVGVVSAAFGVGGGFVFTPFCHAVLGMPASLAVATSMGQIPMLSASGTWRYLKSDSVDYRRGLTLLIGALPSAQLVAWWLAREPANPWQPVWRDQTVPDLMLLGFFTVCIGGLGVYNLRKGRSQQSRDSYATRKPLSPSTLAASGVVFGALSALLGIGGGFFAVPIFTYLCGMTPVRAVATSLFAVMVTSAITTAHYLWLGQIHFAVSLVIASGSVLGARVGAGLALKIQPERLLITLGTAQIIICTVYLGLEIR